MNAGRTFGWIATLALTLQSISLAQQIAIAKYPYAAYPGITLPGGIAPGPDGALWFGEDGGIGRISTAGVITQYSVAGSPAGIASGPDGALWFTLTNSIIGRITTSGVITEYPVPTNSSLGGITSGPDGALWFTEGSADQIGRIATDGAISEYPVPTAGSNPYAITAGPDGALWFTEEYGDKIARITTAGAITDYPVPTANVWAFGIAAGPDGALWFTESADGVSKIGRVTTAGAFTEYPTPNPDCGPYGITPGPDGALWFTEFNSGYIGRINAIGGITEYPVPTPSEIVTYGSPEGIVTGPDGELWFTDTGGFIGEVVFVTADLTVSPDSGPYPISVTFTGSGFAPNESVRIYVSGVGSSVLSSATADANGSFTAAAREPPSPYGPRIFLAVGQSSGKLAAASFSATARLIINPKSGAVGSRATARGFGFGSFQTVNVYWNNPRTLLGTATTDANGSFDGPSARTFTIPVGSPPGTDTVFGFERELQAIIGPGFFTVQ
jgi:virginiamycin B lyase